MYYDWKYGIYEEGNVYMRDLCSCLFYIENGCKCVIVNSVGDGIVIFKKGICYVFFEDRRKGNCY